MYRPCTLDDSCSSGLGKKSAPRKAFMLFHKESVKHDEEKQPRSKGDIQLAGASTCMGCDLAAFGAHH